MLITRGEVVEFMPLRELKRILCFIQPIDSKHILSVAATKGTTLTK